MSERITLIAKKSLLTKENPIFHKQKTDFQSERPHVDQILFLQKTVGNQAVQRLIKSGALQAKLKMGHGDTYEEADRVAETVMNIPKPQAVASGALNIQRACPSCEEERNGDAYQVTPDIAASIESQQMSGKSPEPVTSREMESSFGRNPGISSGAPMAVQLKPNQVTAHSFLGLNIGGGVNPTLASRLDNVAAQLNRDYQSVHGAPATNDTVVRNWAGINNMSGWRQRSTPSRSKHCSGSAVDVNYTNQPYIVTRSEVNGREVLGGERAGRRLTSQRQATVDVFDRAKEFVFGRININIPIFMPFSLIFIPISLPNRADVSERRTGESTGEVFDRFKETSNALGTYLGLAFYTAPDTVRRQPINNIETASEADLLREIPTTERKTEAAGIADIQAYIRAHLTTAGTGPTFHFSTGDVSRARDFYFRMLRDYEHVRIPMVRGNPVARPGNTRNPARGFLDMSREFVVAMADVGRLRWGISDLGSAESGDTHHFDLGNHGGVTPDCLP